MPKPATHHQLRHHHNLLLLCVLALFVILGILAFKYVWVKSSWRQNSVSLQNGIQKYQSGEAVEEGNIIGATIVSVPPIIPMIKTPSMLQSYVSKIGGETQRVIVVLNKDMEILADTTPSNVGQKYTKDENNVIGKTMESGEPDQFIEKSAQYPNGITLQVVQLKDMKGSIIGAILVSPSNVFNN